MPHHPLIQRLLALPRAKALALIVAASIGVSVLITLAISALPGSRHGDLRFGLSLAIAVPLLVATPVISVLLGLLHALEAARCEAQRLACTDLLTGTLNRRRFIDLAERELARARHDGTPVSLLLLDLDDFKKINDLRGHQAGDEVLKMAAQRCQRLLRPGDALARWGGEEFAVLLPQVGRIDAIAMALRVRDAIAGAPAGTAPGQPPPHWVTASVGVATDEHGTGSLEALLSQADQAMYQAKRGGKNTAVAAPRLLVAA